MHGGLGRPSARIGLMDVPLFPLHAVLCPGAVLPLHIFEPRYPQMIGRCLAADPPFGVVPLPPRRPPRGARARGARGSGPSGWEPRHRTPPAAPAPPPPRTPPRRPPAS